MTYQSTVKAADLPFRTKYGNYIGGEFKDALSGRTFDNLSPITGQKLCEVAR